MNDFGIYKLNFTPQDQFASNQIASTESMTVWNLTLMEKINEITELVKTIISKQEKIDLNFCENCTSVIINDLNNDKYRLNRPISVLIKKDNSEGSYIAETLDINIYGYGDDEKESVDSLKIAIVDIFQDLFKNEKNLSEHLKRQFYFLKNIIDNEV